MRTAVALAIASLLSVGQPSRARARNDFDAPPLYTYAVKSWIFTDAGLFTGPVHLVIPNTAWLCDLSFTGMRVDRTLAMMARCSTPVSTGKAEVITRVSCSSADQDTATMHLSMVEENKFASVYIACRREAVDDGF